MTPHYKKLFVERLALKAKDPDAQHAHLAIVGIIDATDELLKGDENSRLILISLLSRLALQIAIMSCDYDPRAARLLLDEIMGRHMIEESPLAFARKTRVGDGSF